LAGEKKLVALYAGLHGLAQGLSQIIEAASALSDLPELQFVLMGDGPEKKMLMDQAKQKGLENIRFLESRPSRELPPIVAAADIIMVTLKMFIPGAVPSKLYEAMASGLPVLVSNRCGCARDLVREGVNGFTFDPGNRHELVARLLEMASLSDKEREHLGDNSCRIAGNFAPERFGEGLEQAARLALNHPRKASLIGRALIIAIENVRPTQTSNQR
jgi:glycosyltransferase involved in cell wall biosynthesis